MTVKLNPLADRVVVKPLEEKEQKKGGIIIPDTAKEKPQEGKVVAVGPGKVAESGERIKPEVKKGDRVLYGKYSGHRSHGGRRRAPDPARERHPGDRLTVSAP